MIRLDRRLVLAGFMVAIPPLLAFLLVLDNAIVAMAVVALIGFVTMAS